MADYRELLRKAVEALPENNGVSRRQVYEKARSALVSQLRSLEPPIPPREITQHRLQLEDCIRQVEQQATDALLGGLKAAETQPAPRNADASPAAAEPVSAEEPADNRVPEKHGPGQDNSGIAPEKSAAADTEMPAGPTSADEKPAASPPTPEKIIAEAQSAGKGSDDGSTGRQIGPSTVKMHERSDLSAREHEVAIEPPHGTGDMPPPMMRGNVLDNIDPEVLAPHTNGTPYSAASFAAPASPAASYPAAMSSVREVETGELQHSEHKPASLRNGHDSSDDQSDSDPQVAVDRAIAALDREARGDRNESGGGEHGSGAKGSSPKAGLNADAGFHSGGADDSDRGGNALMVFMIVFGLLLAGGGGAGYWAWQEGYLDSASLFGRGEEPAPAVAASISEAIEEPQDAVAVEQGNTTSAQPAATVVDPTSAEPQPQLQESPASEIVEPDPAGTAPENTLPFAAEPDPASEKTEDRLPSAEEPVEVAATETVPGASELVPEIEAAGSQSLLLEASSEGTTGAVPFSGTVEWTRGVDDLGLPTIVASAQIPARNLGVDVLINRNCDPALPASHIIEIRFDFNDGFLGGNIARLGDVLFKNEELVAGTRLSGASARVAPSHFLYALSDTEQDLASNMTLMADRKWMDIEMVYATGTGAIVVLEKDTAAQQMFSDVLGVWQDACQTG